MGERPHKSHVPDPGSPGIVKYQSIRGRFCLLLMFRITSSSSSSSTLSLTCTAVVALLLLRLLLLRSPSSTFQLLAQRNHNDPFHENEPHESPKRHYSPSPPEECHLDDLDQLPAFWHPSGLRSVRWVLVSFSLFFPLMDWIRMSHTLSRLSVRRRFGVRFSMIYDFITFGPRE